MSSSRKDIRLLPLDREAQQALVGLAERILEQEAVGALRRGVALVGRFSTVVEESSVRYVAVHILADEAGRSWTYLDPFDDLDVGDLVQVPFGAFDSLMVGRVTELDVPHPPVSYVKSVRTYLEPIDAPVGP